MGKDTYDRTKGSGIATSTDDKSWRVKSGASSGHGEERRDLRTREKPIDTNPTGLFTDRVSRHHRHQEGWSSINDDHDEIGETFGEETVEFDAPDETGTNGGKRKQPKRHGKGQKTQNKGKSGHHGNRGGGRH